MYYSVVFLGILAIIFGVHILRDRSYRPVTRPNLVHPQNDQNISNQSSHDQSVLVQSSKKIPLSVNYHLTRECNYKCGFCFHTATDSHIEPIENAQKAMSLLKDAGMKKINFAGGEPFLKAKVLGPAGQILQGNASP